MSTNVYVAGVGSTKFGVLPGRNLQSLATEAARAALVDSNIPSARIGCVFVGNFVGGIMTGQELLGPIVAADLGFIQCCRNQNRAACASSRRRPASAMILSAPGQRMPCWWLASNA